jgi:hypothetical protein
MKPNWLPQHLISHSSFHFSPFGFTLFDQLENEIKPGDFVLVSEMSVGGEHCCLIPGFVLGAQFFNRTNPVVVVHFVYCQEDFSPVIRSFNHFSFEMEQVKKTSGYSFCAKEKVVVKASGFEHQLHRKNYEQLFLWWFEFADFLGKV